MPPTFLIFIGLFLYLGLLMIGFLLGIPMILSKKRKLEGKLIIMTAIISYPILLVIGLTLTIIFALPGIGLAFLFKYLDIPSFVVGVFLLYFIIVFVSAFYHWYLGYVMIKNYLNKIPIDSQIENNMVYSIFIKRVINYYRRNRNI
jgi:hypothetical protein